MHLDDGVDRHLVVVPRHEARVRALVIGVDGRDEQLRRLRVRDAGVAPRQRSAVTQPRDGVVARRLDATLEVHLVTRAERCVVRHDLRIDLTCNKKMTGHQTYLRSKFFLVQG